ncbi:MAG: oligoendopeptidase F [Chloroflexota bacterium]
MAQLAVKAKTRQEIPAEFTWNAPSVFASDAAWDTEYKNIGDALTTLEKFKGHLSESAQTLADALETRDNLLVRVGKVLVYASMSASVDTNNQTAASMESRAYALYSRLFAAASFTDPELLAIGEDTLRQWLAQEPRLTIYGHYIDNLFRLQQHVRSAEVEEVLGMVIDPFASAENIWMMLTNADMTFRPAKSTAGDEMPLFQGSIDSLLGNPDRESRRTAWENYADMYLAHKNTLASTLSSAVKQDVFRARARRYPSALESALFQNNIPVAVFRNLIDVFKRNLPTWHRYWAIRRKALGYDKLYPYDIWAPLTQDDPKVSYPQAVDWISEGLAPLGKEYVEILRRGCLQDRWVDIYPNQGKRSGAFSSGWKGTHPFILMSFTESLESMSTLAHELGHSMHSYLTWQNQPAVSSDYSIFVAEVASNFNQAMVRAYMLEQKPEPAFQIAVIEEAMSNFHRYFFIMPTLARFELEFHERVERGEAPAADDLNTLMADLFTEAYGNEMVVDHDRVGITWSQFPHLYANFYVFQYATGISAAHSLANGILTGKPNSVENYLNFLKSGGSVYPLDVLKGAGVDLTTPEPVEQTFAVLSSLVDRLEKLVG